jgi:folate-dependent phosphoribosylglycinamide formyltransferase PurN
MTDLRKERPVNYLVEHDKPGRKIETFNDIRWGELIIPAPGDNPDKTPEGMRIALFCSWEFGYLVMETLKEYERRNPSRLNLVGLATDNPVNRDARISMKKRIWKFYDRPHRVEMETHIIESGLAHGMPVFTGEVKTEAFHEVLKGWRPDAILMCVFGQLVDPYIINLPRNGMYNFHPSDLTLHMGAGPAPYDDLVTHNATTTVWSVHQVTPEIDSGSVVGQSSGVNVRDMAGKIPENCLLVYDKLTEPLSYMAAGMADALIKRFEHNETGLLEKVDLGAYLPQASKDKLMEPIRETEPMEVFPEVDIAAFDH